MIGRVKHYSRKTDSLVFRVISGIKVDLLKIRLADGTKHDIDLSKAEGALERLLRGTGDNIQLIGRGAQRRGTFGQLSCIYEKSTAKDILEGDIAIESIGKDGERAGQKEITHDGDCGQINLDDQGAPLSMHHALVWYEEETEGDDRDDHEDEDNVKITRYESVSIPLCRVMREHSEFFPDFYPNEEYKRESVVIMSSPQKARPVPHVDKSVFEREKMKGFLGCGRNGVGPRVDIAKIREATERARLEGLLDSDDSSSDEEDFS